MRHQALNIRIESFLQSITTLTTRTRTRTPTTTFKLIECDARSEKSTLKRHLNKLITFCTDAWALRKAIVIQCIDFHESIFPHYLPASQCCRFINAAPWKLLHASIPSILSIAQNIKYVYPHCVRANGMKMKWAKLYVQALINS